MILKKYFKYNFLFFKDNNKDTVIIKKLQEKENLKRK